MNGKKMKFTLFSIFLIFTMKASGADVDKIIERNMYLRAGGLKTEGMKTLNAEAEVRAFDYHSFYKLAIKDNDKIRLDMTLDSIMSATTFNKDSAWITDVYTGDVTKIEAGKVSQTKNKILDQFNIYRNVFIDYKKNGYTADLYSTTVLNEDSVYIIKLKPGESGKDDIYINIHAPSGLEYEIYYGSDPEKRVNGTKVVLKDNHSVGNIFLPHVIETMINGKMQSVRIFKSIKINQPISDSLFLFPKFKYKAEDIIKKHIKAIGGDKALKKLKNIAVEGFMYGITADGSGNDTTRLKYFRMFPGMARIEMLEGKDNHTVFVFGDTSGWHKDPSTGNKPVELIKPLLASLKATIRTYFVFFDDVFVNYKKQASSISISGEVTENGKKYHVIKVKLDSGTEYYYFIDSQTYLITKRMNKILTSENYFTLFYSDYRACGGLKIPYSFESSFEKNKTIINVQKAEVNSKLSKELFELKNN